MIILKEERSVSAQPIASSIIKELDYIISKDVSILTEMVQKEISKSLRGKDRELSADIEYEIEEIVRDMKRKRPNYIPAQVLSYALGIK